MLSDDSATRTVVFGEHGIISTLGPKGIHVALSTLSVELSRELEQNHTKHHQMFVAAPVFGRPETASEGQLHVLVAGPKKALDFCAPLFSAIGQKTWVIGEEPASAHLLKITGNFLLQSAVETLAESFALIRKAGISPETFLNLITGTLFSAPVYKNYGKMLLERKYFQETGFKIPLALKDINLALKSAEALSVPLPTASTIKDQYLTLLGRGGKELDFCALGMLAEENAGLIKQD
jgi:3-hydroxyisobutyrate dehydrogenase-like beta-hydroxyacid dehydrogenase